MTIKGAKKKYAAARYFQAIPSGVTPKSTLGRTSVYCLELYNSVIAIMYCRLAFTVFDH